MGWTTGLTGFFNGRTGAIAGNQDRQIFDAAGDDLRTNQTLAYKNQSRFRQRFWDAISPSSDGKKTLSNMSFLFSQDERFPTWWTRMPHKSPIITAWAPFRLAERLSGSNHSLVVEQSLQKLGELLGVNWQKLESWLEDGYFHDWQSDPFSRGAYSYGKVGAHGAQGVLAARVEDTLFFAGEATNTSGHNGTVIGLSRAATELL